MTASLEALIKAYQIYTALFMEIEPVLSEDIPTAISFSHYIRHFCLAMITRVDADNPQHRHFLNNLTLISMPEMDEKEYRHATTAYAAPYYDNCLYSDQKITQNLLAYDSIHRTQHMKNFVSYFCMIADVFAEQQQTFKQPIREFVTQYRCNMNAFIRSNGNVQMNTPRATLSTLASTAKQTQPHEPQHDAVQTPPRQTFSSGKTVDTQYLLRIFVPALAMIAFIMGAIISGDGMPLLIAIVPLCFWIAGIHASRRRCPRCGAWDSMTTIQSECVEQQKVKVRRNLNSSYYRTSGTHTFGSRQVFVSAEEKNYQEVYRCNICGHQMTGTRRTIDDGIR